MRPVRKTKGGGKPPPSEDIAFVSSGCTVLDLMLGGGWPLGRIFNIVGDKSTGKTLLAIEACANFNRKYPTGRMCYREAEAAFDQQYAASIGMPVKRISFVGDRPFDTIEDFYEDLNEQCDIALSKRTPGLYILDSLDALTDESEQKREFDAASYGGGKSKKLSELFRRSVRKIEQAHIAVGIISQVRANIGVAFGRKTTRSGGKALDFYSSQTIYVSHVETLYRIVMGDRMAYGVRIRVKCDKNKVAPAFRECEFPIYFGYGIEDLIASTEFLISTARTKAADLSESDAKKLIKSCTTMRNEDYNKHLAVINAAVRSVWHEREAAMKPSRSKYT
jgi:recombination protein RecA